MKRNHTYLSIRHILLAVAAIALGACTSREYTRASGLGWVDFTVSTSESVFSPMPEPSYSLSVSTADGAYSHTWKSLADYPKYEPYTIGRYKARALSGSLGAEGYDCACYSGETNFEVIEAKYSSVNIDCRLTQAVIDLTIGEGLARRCPGAKVTVHSSGHSYVTADAANKKTIYLTPGTTYLYVTVEDGMGSQATVAPDFRIETDAATKYDILVDMVSDEILHVVCGDIDARMPISAAIFQSAPPVIETHGFVSGTVFNIIEGFPAAEPIRMVIKAPAGLSAAILTSVSESADLPAECDLLDPSTSLESRGLNVDRVDDETLIVDFTRLLENVGVQDNSYLTFLLQARDRLNRVSQASMLRVAIKSVDLTQRGNAYAAVGSKSASIDLALTSPDFNRDDFTIYVLDADGAILKTAEITDFKADRDSKSALIDFVIDDGFNDIPVRVDFMGNPKLYTTVERTVPEYDIFVDAFALGANIYVTTENDVLRDIIVKNAVPIANGSPASILSRNTEDGCIAIAQLSPATAYDISTLLIPGKYAPTVRVTTEKTEQVPSGDFEDFEDLLQYKRLPCGGAYSNTVFPIFNMQNYKSIDVKWPQKHWAGTNDKTFCKAAKRQNTWYMYPSAMLDFSMSASGSKSMQMQSVGWSLHGPEIQPYTQDGASQLSYNANVPQVEHRSAGKTFLGSYKFNPSTLSEVYDQGVPFSSRPRSLNGFFQYVSDISVTDYGLVVVELINDAGPEPVSVATASMRFPSSPGFTSFNLPLNYHTIGVKATRLRIMFASSYRLGSIDEEDEAVPTTAHAAQGMYLGSVLRVDNLSFSY